MKILVAAERLGAGGGMERYLEIVLPALAARGILVHVVARDLEAGFEGIAAERVPWADEHDAPSAPARAQLERVLKRERPDVAVAHNLMDAGIVEALRAAPRLAYHVHDHRPFCPNGDRVYPRSKRICTEPLGAPCVVHALVDGCGYGPRPRTLALIRGRERLRDGIARADTIVVASAYVADRAASSRIPPERLREIPLPLPEDAYRSIAARGADDETTSPEEMRPTVVFAGRFVPQKGLVSLVDAVGCIPRASRPRIVAFGEGGESAAARVRAQTLAVDLALPGVAAPHEMRAVIDRAALVAVPSLWAEPFGYVGIEAFARGVPVVAYDVGGIRTWLRDGIDGFAVRRGDSTALGAAIARLLDEPALRRRFAENARAAAERFRSGPIVDALLAAYAA